MLSPGGCCAAADHLAGVTLVANSVADDRRDRLDSGEFMIKVALERLLLATRWLLTPLYLALVLGLLEMLVRAAAKLHAIAVAF